MMNIVVNGTQYSLSCDLSIPEKVINNNNPALKITLIIRNIDTNKELKWDDFKNTYLAEKVSDIIRNRINGG